MNHNLNKFERFLTSRCLCMCLTYFRDDEADSAESIGASREVARYFQEKQAEAAVIVSAYLATDMILTHTFTGIHFMNPDFEHIEDSEIQ